MSQRGYRLEYWNLASLVPVKEPHEGTTVKLSHFLTGQDVLKCGSGMNFHLIVKLTAPISLATITKGGL